MARVIKVGVREIVSRDRVVHVTIPNGHGSREEIEEFIAGLGANDTTDMDLVNEETGEVLWEAGETKRQRARGKPIKIRSPFGRKPVISYFGDPENFDTQLMEFEKFYRVVKIDMTKLVDDVEAMREADYDVEHEAPHYIERRDSLPLDDDDLDNINQYLLFWSDIISTPGRIYLEPWRVSPTRVDVQTTFA